MRFDELPKDQSRWDLRDPDIASGVVDLVVGMRDRLANSVLVLLCSPDGIALRQPVIITDVPWDAPEADRDRAFAWLDHFDDLAMVVAFGRWAGPVTEHDAGWVRSARKAGFRNGIRLLSSWLATRDEVRPLGPDDLAA